MNKNRLESFSDGVIAIIITIMVLELKVPHDPTWQCYIDAYPVFVSYALSFLLVGLYWSNHHHLIHAAHVVDNNILWANLLSLFWLSLIPFTTASMGENHFTSVTVSVYAINLVLVTIFYLFLVNYLCRIHGNDSKFAKTFTGRLKSYITIGCNSAAAMISICGFPKTAFVVIMITSVMWFIPNNRIASN